ncbi:MAG: restriction endonuclease subunit S [Gammaproteobacteria bacterium]|nr:restriction endonuclease subunit S [Gammaproteobacteria bacterium]
MVVISTRKEISLLGDLISLYGGGTPSKEKPEYWEGDIPWATVKDLKKPILLETQDSISKLGLAKSSSKMVEAGTIILATRMAVGRVSITDIDVAINQDLKAIVCSDKIDVKYLFYLLFSEEKYFNRVSSGATVKGIKISHITDMEIPLPPLAEQKKIAAILDAADDLRQKDQQIIDHYTQLGKSLFLEMFGDPVVNPMGWESIHLSEISDY